MKRVNLYFALIILAICSLVAADNLKLPSADSLNSFIVNNDLLILNDSVPDDFPMPIVITNNGVSAGYYFVGMIPGQGTPEGMSNYLMILDSSGNPKAYRKVGEKQNRIPLNFMQSDCGKLVNVEKTPKLGGVYVSDTSLVKLDSVINDNTMKIMGYFLLLPNGHYVLMQFETEPIDLSLLFEEGEPNASIRTSTIYEYDKDKNLVFQWRALDYIPVGDTYQDTLANFIAYIHTNNVEPDYDGNYLISSRHLSEITKINKQTGEIMWRLGGKRNEFQFINEHEENAPNYFSYQHDIRRLSNGNISVFDNGTQHPGKYSRGVEYELDEENKTATMVWEYRHDPDIYAVANGSCQRLPDGNVVIGWGQASSAPGMPAITEVKPDGTVAFELRYQQGFKSMRAVKYPLTYTASDQMSKEILLGNKYRFSDSKVNTCISVTINELDETFYPTLYVAKYDFSPMDPDFSESPAPMVFKKRITIKQSGVYSLNIEVRFNSACLGINRIPEAYKVYSRDTLGKGIFVQLPTVYDAATGELVINTDKLGEFMFAIPQPETKPNTPVLLTPGVDEKINHANPVHLSWSPRGYFTSSHVQIASDEGFSDLILDDKTIRTINIDHEGLEIGNTYFWRVRNINGGMTGDWSPARSFTPSQPFISLLNPIGGEKLVKDSSRYIIRWEKNVIDPVSIKLYRGGELFSVIIDTLNSVSGAYSWTIPSEVPEDSTYKIKIFSLNDESLTTISADNFYISDDGTGVNDMPGNKDGLAINNYPNPSDGNTNFEFFVPNSGSVLLRVYNLNGTIVSTVLNSYLAAGYHEVDWNAAGLLPGVYYYRLAAGPLSATKKLLIVK